MNSPVAALRGRLSRCEKTLKALRRKSQDLNALVNRLASGAVSPTASRRVDTRAS